MMSSCLTEGCLRNNYDSKRQGYAYCLKCANNQLTKCEARVEKLEKGLHGSLISRIDPKGFLVKEEILETTGIHNERIDALLAKEGEEER